MDDKLDFVPQRVRLSEQVADQVERLITEDSLKTGEQLPGERDMAIRLGVSRTVIREAIRVLGVRGLVEIKPGSGTYIKELTLDRAAEPIERLLRMRGQTNDFANLHEIRRTLEVEIARLAAERATNEDILNLEEVYQKQAKHMNDAELFTKYDFEFHNALATATGNDLFGLLLSPISDLLLAFRMQAYQHDPEGSIQGAIVFHQKILDCIRARDSIGAKDMMIAHLDQAAALYWATQASE